MSDIDDKQKKIRYAAYEIIDTEKTYLSRLKAVHEVYALPLKDLNILDNKDWELQFGCWDELYKISKNFYEKLGPQRDSLTPKIGKVFLEFCEDKDFLIYKTYLVNFEIALNRRAVLSTTNKKFGNFVTDARSDPRCFNFGIESLLTEPVSRVPRYKLLLEQLLKYVPPNNEEYECLTKSYAKVTEIAIENNEAIRARENKEKIMEIMLTIDIKTRINLLDDENRKFIRSGNLERQCRRTIKEFMFWLFSDKLLYGELLTGVTSSSYNLNRTINLHECLITEGGTGVVERGDCAFTVQSPAKSFVVFTKTVEEKNGWLTDINAAVSIVRQKLQAETGRIAPIWLPDSAVNACQVCNENFNMIRRKHHCRHCGLVLCNDCTKDRVFLRHVDAVNKVRVCKKCFEKLKTEPTTKQDMKTSSSNNLPMTPRGITSMRKAAVGTFDLQTFLKYRSAVLDEIDPSRKSAVVRSEDDDLTPGHNCCNVCVSEFSMFKTKQTCMNCGSNVCSDCSRNKFFVPHVDPKNEVRVCNNCHIKLNGGLTYESFAQVENSSPFEAIRRKSLALKQAVFPTPAAGAVPQYAIAPAPNSIKPKPDRRKSRANGFSSYFDLSAYIRAHYAVMDQITSISRADNVTPAMVSKSALAGQSTSKMPEKCRCCANEYNNSKNQRSECKNCGPNVCADCVRRETIVPHLNKERKSRVCNRCYVLLTSHCGTELLQLHMQFLEDTRNGTNKEIVPNLSFRRNPQVTTTLRGSQSNTPVATPRNAGGPAPPTSMTPLNLTNLQSSSYDSNQILTPTSLTSPSITSPASPTTTTNGYISSPLSPTPPMKKSVFSTLFGSSKSTNSQSNTPVRPAPVPAPADSNSRQTRSILSPTIPNPLKTSSRSSVGPAISLSHNGSNHTNSSESNSLHSSTERDSLVAAIPAPRSRNESTIPKQYNFNNELKSKLKATSYDSNEIVSTASSTPTSPNSPVPLGNGSPRIVSGGTEGLSSKQLMMMGMTAPHGNPTQLRLPGHATASISGIKPRHGT